MNPVGTINLAAVESAYLEHYLGAWAMKEDTFRAAFERIRQMNLQVHVQQVADARGAGELQSAGPGGSAGGYEYSVLDGGIALLSISGTMMKFVSSLSRGTSTVMMRRSLRAAMKDEAVAGVMLVIDSPGGTTAGTLDLAGEIAAVAAVKPVHAYVDGLCCSAAMWAASQANVISAGPDAIVGSIGTYAVIEDLSGMAAMEGVKVHVVRAGEYKGAGTPGTEVTADHLAEWQRIVNDLNAHFLAGVARGRRMPLAQVQAIADGRAHVGAAAKALNLVDQIERFDAALERLRAAVSGRTGRNGTSRAGGGRSDVGPVGGGAQAEDAGPAAAGSDAEPQQEADMGQQNAGGTPATQQAPASQEPIVPAQATASAAPAAPAQPVAATIAELESAFADDPKFALSAAKQGMSLMAAKAAYADVLAERLKAEQTKQAAAQTAPAAVAKKPGVPAVESAGKASATAAGGSDAVAEFESRVQVLVDGGMPRHKAAQKVLGADAQLRADYVAALSAA